jgi:hypothetical protein
MTATVTGFVDFPLQERPNVGIITPVFHDPTKRVEPDEA